MCSLSSSRLHRSHSSLRSWPAVQFFSFSRDCCECPLWAKTLHMGLSTKENSCCQDLGFFVGLWIRVSQSLWCTKRAVMCGHVWRNQFLLILDVNPRGIQKTLSRHWPRKKCDACVGTAMQGLRHIVEWELLKMLFSGAASDFTCHPTANVENLFSGWKLLQMWTGDTQEKDWFAQLHELLFPCRWTLGVSLNHLWDNGGRLESDVTDTTYM